MDVDYIRQVPITKERYTYTKSRTTNIFDDIINDDVPSIVKKSYSKAVEDDIPIYTSQYTPTSPYRSSLREDDISFKARPNTDYVVNREYHQYGPLPRWNDTLEVSTQFPELRRSPSPFRAAPSVYSETHPTRTTYMPSYVPRSSLLMDRDPPKFDRFDPKSKPDRSSRPYFLQPELPRYYPSGTKPEDASRRISSRLNTEFPFRKYRSDFVPYAPYHNMYDSMKYCPNPDWVTMRPWGHRFRKARFVYVPEDKNSSTSMEIERVMREARMRELCKGIYSSSYGDDITSRVNLATDFLDNKAGGPKLRRPDVKAAEAEIAPTAGEKERRKPRSLADKRKRNETLAVGLSRTELLKNDNESPTSSKLSTSSIPPKEVTPIKKNPAPQPKEPTPPPRDPTPPPREPTPPPKEPTPPPKEPTPPPKEPTPPPKDPTPPPKDPTPPPKDPTPPPKDPTPPPKDPTPPPKDPTPPPKDPTPPPKDPTPPPKEPTPPPPKEPTPPPPKEPTPPPPREPTPPPPKEPTPPPPKEPTPPPPKEPTPPPKEPTPPPPPEKELTPPPPRESTPPPEEEVSTPKEECMPKEEASPEKEIDIVAESVEEYKEETERPNNPEMFDEINGNMEDSFQLRAETGHYMVEEVDNGDGQIIRTEYMIEEIELAK